MENNKPPDQIQVPDPEQKARETRVRRFHRNFLLVALIISGLIFLWIIKYFLVPIIVAAAFASLFYSFYKKIAKRLWNHGGISSLLTCMILILGLLIPAYLVGALVVSQATTLYSTAQETVKDWAERGDEGLLGQIRSSRIVRWIHLQDIEWGKVLEESIQTVGAGVTALFNAMSKNIISFFANFLIIFFVLFYFFRDGDVIVSRLQEISPLHKRYEQDIIRRFTEISKATVKGTILVGLTQGTVGAVVLLISGINTWALWGVVMAILAIIPMLGPYIVMVPAGIIQIMLGSYLRGIFTLVMGTVVIGSIDNVMRPHVVGRGAKMHDLIIFFSTLGGIAVFGILGFIVGPVIAALFLTLLEIFVVEFRPELEVPDKIQLT